MPPMPIKVEITPTTFWLKCINLPKSPNFTLHVNWKLLIKHSVFNKKMYPMNWQMRGVKPAYQALLYTKVYYMSFGAI